MTSILNFKKLEVTGATQEEALAKAPFAAKFDATNAFKKWKNEQTEGITEAAIKNFCLNFLESKTKNIPGAGCYITVVPAIADTSKRPYVYTNVKRDGTIRVRTTYVWVDDATGQDVCKTVSTSKHRATKADSVKLMKSKFASGEFRGSAHQVVRQEEEKPVIIGKMKYNPSKNAQVGSYIVFGIEA